NYTVISSTFFLSSMVLKLDIKAAFSPFFTRLQGYMVNGDGNLREIVQLISNPFLINTKIIRSIPAVRFPHTQWFKLDKEYDDIQRITRIQAMRAFAENRPTTVINKKYLFFDFYPQQKSDALYWIYAPISLHINQNTMPILWTNMPDEGILYVKELHSPTVSLASLLESIINNPSKIPTSYYFEKIVCAPLTAQSTQTTTLKQVTIHKMNSFFRCTFMTSGNAWYEALLTGIPLSQPYDAPNIVARWLQTLKQSTPMPEQEVPPTIIEQIQSMQSVVQAQKNKIDALKQVQQNPEPEKPDQANQLIDALQKLQQAYTQLTTALSQ
ncbi:MAG: hypothetical protein WCE21_03010, partial [Candidatus Babeliales bacterium]